MKIRDCRIESNVFDSDALTKARQLEESYTQLADLFRSLAEFHKFEQHFEESILAVDSL